MNWLRSSPIHCSRTLLCSVDFTFTSHRTERRISYALKGGPQPECDTSIPRFTNCIVTCIWADGELRTPSVLFTYNPQFRFDRPGTSRRDDQLEHLENCLQLFNIDPKRVIYVGEKKGEKRCYVSENAQLLRQFFELYSIQSNWTALTDNGNAFYEEGTSV